ncbi:hypothetical protein AB4Z48_16755 [Cupriavidus sp. 2TAF22]|uniref:hypothetical protein n=1 Tax=unclassified Cupriavidus TaxID=2640874 RepID=UPI003F8F4D8A
MAENEEAGCDAASCVAGVATVLAVGVFLALGYFCLRKVRSDETRPTTESTFGGDWAERGNG